MRVGGGAEGIVSTDPGSSENVTFSVLVRARDDGWPPLSTTSTLYVVIVNIASPLDDDQLVYTGWTEAGASSAHPRYRSDHVCTFYISVGREDFFFLCPLPPKQNSTEVKQKRKFLLAKTKIRLNSRVQIRRFFLVLNCTDEYFLQSKIS